MQQNTELASNLLHVEDVLLSLVIRPVRPGRGVQQQRHVQLNKGYVQLKKGYARLNKGYVRLSKGYVQLKN
jgi:hypothetical protein